MTGVDYSNYPPGVTDSNFDHLHGFDQADREEELEAFYDEQDRRDHEKRERELMYEDLRDRRRDTGTARHSRGGKGGN